MPQAQEKDTTRCGYFGNKLYAVTICNRCWKDYVRTMLNLVEWIFISPYEMANQRIYNLGSVAMSLVANP
jgi:hypothetical protein